MQESERQIIQQFTVSLKRDIIPIEMLPYLWCLTEDDCESIQFKQEREGPRAAVPTLLDRLKKRVGAFEQFLTALEQTGCPHLKTLLQNAMRDQTHRPQSECNCNTTVTETTSNAGPENLKTPTTETARPFPGSTLTKTEQPLTSVTPKKRNKTPKTKTNRIPKENTTSPPETKTHNKTKTKPLKSHQEHNIPAGAKTAKATKDMPTTPPQKFSGSQQITKCPSATPKKIICSAGKATKDMPTTPPQKLSASQQITQCPSTTPKKSICTAAKTDPTPTFQPSETEFIKHPTTHFDTLVCYAKKNCEIALELKQFLESHCGLKVCIDLFNFVPGKAITDNICESINSSQSIIFLLSHEFLGKFWAPWELKNAVYDFNASQQYGKSKKIIPVLLEECPVPDDLKIYQPIKMEGSGSRKGSWKKIAETVLGRPFQDSNDVDGVDEDSVVDVSNNDGVHDKVDNGINSDDEDVLDGYDDGEDDNGDTNNDGADDVGNTNGSNNAVDDSNSGGSYHDENDVDGSDNCGVEDDDDGVDTSSDGEEDCVDEEDHDDDDDDDGGDDDVRDGTHNSNDDDSSNGDCNGSGDHDEDGQDDEGASDSSDDVGHGGFDHVEDSVDAGDEEHPNHNDGGIDENDVDCDCDDGGGKNNDDNANNENKNEVNYNNIKSL